MRIAHISDLHFSKPTYSPLQFFSKRWIGNFNLLFSRKRDYLATHLVPLPDLFQAQRVQHVIISGDLSTTSRPQEFEAAASFVEELKKKGFSVTLLPGNHDQYTQGAYRQKRFYHYFSCPLSLKDQGVAAQKLDPHWWIVTLDTALATSWFFSGGLFSPQIEEHLRAQLATLPKEDSVILVNHFPFFQNDRPHVWLERGPELQALIQSFPKVKLYLHGHSHRRTIADLRADGLPLIMDSGCASHRFHGSWNLLDLAPKVLTVEPFYWQEGWKPGQKELFSW